MIIVVLASLVLALNIAVFAWVIYKLPTLREDKMEKLFIVRLYDMFDGWIDISEPVEKKEAERIWNKETDNGTKNTKYSDGDYYSIFPADTKMVFTPESMGR